MSTRAFAARHALTIEDLAAPASMLDTFSAGERELSGLAFYYELERSTSLLQFHTMLREGPRNRDASGLQQSYGDHNRLLMLGLDKLVDGDLAWYRSRVQPPGDISDAELVDCFRAVDELGLSREVLAALWLAAALHDCGMLCGRGAYVDVEDGVVLARTVLDALCPTPLVDFATVVLHHHDYIKGVLLGEVPAAMIADDLIRLDSALRPLASAALGMVQVAGAASLGQGRLDHFRVEIQRRCFAGTALDDSDPVTRLARLLTATPSCAFSTDAAAQAADAWGRVGDGRRGAVEVLLARAAIHRWQHVATALGPDERMAALLLIADTWSGSDTDHVLLSGTPWSEGAPPSVGAVRIDTPLSGSRLLVVDT